MSQLYPTVKTQIMQWILTNSLPAGVVVKMCGVDNTYAFNAAHNDLPDIAAKICVTGVELAAVTYAGGLLDAADPVYVGVTPGPTLKAFVVYFDWGTGTQLICYIDTSTDGSLPQALVSPSFAVRLDPAGICQL